jgi:hypothetical protein
MAPDPVCTFYSTVQSNVLAETEPQSCDVQPAVTTIPSDLVWLYKCFWREFKKKYEAVKTGVA